LPRPTNASTELVLGRKKNLLFLSLLLFFSPLPPSFGQWRWDVLGVWPRKYFSGKRRSRFFSFLPPPPFPLLLPDSDNRAGWWDQKCKLQSHVQVIPPSLLSSPLLLFSAFRRCWSRPIQSSVQEASFPLFFSSFSN